MNLGRFQLGQIVNLSVATVSPPDTAPTVTITDSLLSVIQAFKVAMDGGVSLFSVNLLISLAYSLGTFSVTYQYSVGGVSHTTSDTFEVIAGGDPGGQVISLYAYDRPEARYAVAQLSNGMIVQGRNPRL